MRVMFKSATKAISKFFKKHGTKLLVVGAVSGTVGAVTEAIIVTPKAIKKLEEAEEVKGEELTVVEKIKTAAPLYLPCGLLAAQSIACAIGCEVVHRKKEVVLLSALTTTKTAFDEYKKVARELVETEKEGEETKEVSLDQKIRNKMAQNHFDEEDVSDRNIYGRYSEGLYKCRDSLTGQYFWSNQMRIDNAAAKCNERMRSGQDCCIPHATFLEEAGGEECDLPIAFEIEENDKGRIEPMYSTCRDKEGRPCVEISYRYDPVMDIE